MIIEIAAKETAVVDTRAWGMSLRVIRVVVGVQPTYWPLVT
jgi:hypothetical protein